jgi:hypothetical protein
MRIKAHIWISAYIRRLGAEFIPAVVARKGDADAGAIYIKIATLDGNARVLRPAIAGWDGAATDRSWSLAFKGESVEDRKADDYLARQAELRVIYGLVSSCCKTPITSNSITTFSTDYMAELEQ